MTIYELKIGSDTIRYMPLKEAELDLPNCDKDGKELIKEQITKSAYKFKYADGTEYKGTIYKSLNGTAIDKGLKTKEIKDSEFEIVDRFEALDLKPQHLYFVELSNYFKEKIGDKGTASKAVKFNFSNGQYSSYTAYIYNYANSFLMVLGNAYITELIAEAKEKTPKTQTKLNELKSTDGVNKVSVLALAQAREGVKK